MKAEGPVIAEELAAWFRALPRAEVVTKRVIARRIQKIRRDSKLPDISITEDHVHRALAKVRAILESTFQCTLYRIVMSGESVYKVSTPAEMAEYTAKWVKRTVLYADRTYRLVDAVHEVDAEKLLAHELRKEFGVTSGRIKEVSEAGKTYLKVVAGLAKTGLTVRRLGHENKK